MNHPPTPSEPELDHELLPIVPLDWTTQGHEFITRLEETLPLSGLRFDGLEVQPEGDSAKITISIRSGAGAPFEFAASAAPAEIQLIGQASSRGIELSGLSAKFDQGLLDDVALCLSAAADRVGKHEAYPWNAVIGHPAERTELDDIRLRRPATVDGIRLESAEELLVDVIRDESDLFRTGYRRAVPIRATGVEHSYSVEAASHRVARRLRTLCGLLSVAWGTALITRHGFGLDNDGRPIPIQALSTAWIDLDLDPDFYRLRGELVDVPLWVEEAVRRVRSRPWLQNSLDAYMEGTALMTHHASLACVGFTAAIESVATRVYRLPRCSLCGNEHGLTDAFRAVLARCLKPEEASQLAAVYSQRSKTLHQGRLHGGEAARGAFGWVGFPDEAVHFQMVLHQLERAARSVLTWSLSDPHFPASRAPLPRFDGE